MQRSIEYQFSGGRIIISLDAVSTSAKDGAELSRAIDDAFSRLVVGTAVAARVLGGSFSEDAEPRTADIKSNIGVAGVSITIRIDATAQSSDTCDGAFVELLQKSLSQSWHNVIDAFKPKPETESFFGFRDLFNQVDGLLLVDKEGSGLGPIGDLLRTAPRFRRR